jgi:hypothetical protein
MMGGRGWGWRCEDNGGMKAEGSICWDMEMRKSTQPYTVTIICSLCAATMLPLFSESI